MSCCGNFSAVGVAPATTPSHHVNFSTGMVLGVDDYAQEFAYHSARDKWIVRDFGGYGTLSGLAVSIENGADGPQVKVTAGSAATPGGQLICVAADQCGSLNAWLAREDIAAQVATIAAQVAPDTDANLKVWLTLCYTSCAVAPVPIPGQPCRSEDDLMAPSRQADDYILSLSLTPPAMTEAQALDILGTYVSAMAPLAGAPAINIVRARIRNQLDALFLPQPGAIPAAALSPLTFQPAHRAELLRFVRNEWITRYRPSVMAQKCNGPDVAANNCVLLSTFSFAVSKPPVGAWNVVGGVANVDQDESDRPLLMSPALAASNVGITAPVPDPGKTIGFFTAANPVAARTLGATVAVALVQLAATDSIILPGAGANALQRRVFVRNVGTVMIDLRAAVAAGRVDGQQKLDLAAGAWAHLISDGAGSWRLLSKSV